MKAKVAFLDRDGVINIDYGYVYQKEKFCFIDGVVEALKSLTELGFEIVIVTNQAGIARGLYSHEDYKDLTQWYLSELDKEGIKISRVYYCPHHPTKSKRSEDNTLCNCRKPNPGMLERAASDMSIDVGSSIMVGDKLSDMLAGHNFGVSSLFLVGEKDNTIPYSYSITKCKDLKDVVNRLSDCNDNI